jgi:gamma-glutamyl phosphate reductase
MADREQLRQILEDLVDVLHLQAKELEKLVERVEQVAGRLDPEPRFSTVVSELSELHLRVKKLAG